MCSSECADFISRATHFYNEETEKWLYINVEVFLTCEKSELKETPALKVPPEQQHKSYFIKTTNDAQSLKEHMSRHVGDTGWKQETALLSMGNKLGPESSYP